MFFLSLSPNTHTWFNKFQLELQIIWADWIQGEGLGAAALPFLV